VKSAVCLFVCLSVYTLSENSGPQEIVKAVQLTRTQSRPWTLRRVSHAARCAVSDSRPCVTKHACDRQTSGQTDICRRNSWEVSFACLLLVLAQRMQHLTCRTCECKKYMNYTITIVQIAQAVTDVLADRQTDRQIDCNTPLRYRGAVRSY